jgi:hypothetical protein
MLLQSSFVLLCGAVRVLICLIYFTFCAFILVLPGVKEKNRTRHDMLPLKHICHHLRRCIESLCCYYIESTNLWVKFTFNSFSCTSNMQVKTFNEILWIIESYYCIQKHGCGHKLISYLLQLLNSVVML